MNILVTDGNSRASLAVVRALGTTHRVTVGSTRERSLASVSRFCHKGFAYPDPISQQDRFLDLLEETVRREEVDLLVPVTDIAAFIVAENRHRFEPRCRVPLAPLKTLRAAADKAALLRLALELDVPVPKTMFVEHRDALPIDIEPSSFPLVIKPARSRVRVGHRWTSTSVTYANDTDALKQMLASIPDPAYPVMLQERIHGDGMGLFACYDQGRCIALFSHRRLREKPPSGGVSVLREAVPLDPAAAACATRLLDRLAWHGVAMVEFKRDVRDGQPKLMEINGRFWGSLQLAIDAGLDFPNLLLRIGDGNGELPRTAYRAGVRSRWLWGDIDTLLMLLFNNAERAKLLPSQRSRLRAIREFLRIDPNTRLEILRWNDLRPWLLETSQWFRG